MIPLNNLSEGISTIRRTIIQKRAAAGGAGAMSAARKNNDPLYSQYVLINKKRIELKNRILAKYKNAGRKTAMSVR